MRIASIGTGSMGSALLAGIVRNSSAQVVATTRSAESARALAQKFAASPANETALTVSSLEDDPRANVQAVAGAEVVLVGVKPWMMADTLKEIAPAVSKDALIVSMAAGFSLALMEQALPGHALARIMPNTPAQLGLGVIAVAGGSRASETQLAELVQLLSGAGKVFRVTEDQIGAMTAISGSGVAYFFLLAEHLVTTGMELGLPANVARDMVVQTALGAGTLLAQNPDPGGLRAAVTSKGGTTHAAIETFNAHGLAATVHAAGQAAVDRGLEMEKENGGQ